MSGEQLVTIFIPIYNQPDLLDRCLQSIRMQTLELKKYKIVLMDDRSNISYDQVLQKNYDLPITRIINEKNLGAVPNMIHCIHYPVDTPYKIVFHEDDIMHPSLLENELATFAKANDIAWVGTNMTFFNKPESIRYIDSDKQPIYFNQDVQLLAEIIAKGCSLSLASIMYRSAVASDACWDLEKYSMLGDRQMLLELGKRYGCAYFKGDLVAAYDHSDVDYRWKSLTKEHINNFYQYLSSYFTSDVLKQKEIISGFTRAIVDNVKLLPDTEQRGKWLLYYKLYKAKLISIKYFLLTMPRLRKLTTFIKKII